MQPELSLCQRLDDDHSEKPFVCVSCGKGFTTAGALTTHGRTRTGKTRYVCATCGQNCLAASHLTQHARTNAGEKPFNVRYLWQRFCLGQ